MLGCEAGTYASSFILILILILMFMYLSTAIGLTLRGSSTHLVAVVKHSVALVKHPMAVVPRKTVIINVNIVNAWTEFN